MALDNMWMYAPFIPAIIIFSIIGIVFFLVFYFEKKRKLALTDEAMKIGFSFDEKGDDMFINRMEAFKFFNKGHSHRARNIMKGRRNSIGLTITDYRYTTSGGKNSNTYNQTVCIAHIGTYIPGFNLTRENFFHKIGEAFGMKDIDFESNESFSKKFFLRGHDEKAIRSLFSSSILSFFDSQDIKFNVEAEHQDLVIFTPNKKVKPENINSFIQDVLAIVDVFKKELEKSL